MCFGGDKILHGQIKQDPRASYGSSRTNFCRNMASARVRISSIDLALASQTTNKLDCNHYVQGHFKRLFLEVVHPLCSGDEPGHIFTQTLTLSLLDIYQVVCMCGGGKSGHVFTKTLMLTLSDIKQCTCVAPLSDVKVEGYHYRKIEF